MKLELTKEFARIRDDLQVQYFDIDKFLEDKIHQQDYEQLNQRKLALAIVLRYLDGKINPLKKVERQTEELY